jgi:hypothetical protein
MINWIKSLFSKKENAQISIPQRPLTDDEFNERRASKQQKMDKILEKISKSGMESLSQHEKNFLKNYGKN